MLLSSRLPLTDLINLSRALRHNLDAGITLQQVFSQQAKRGTPSLRPVADRINQHLKKGFDLETALEDEHRTFPPLFVSLVRVGEQTGTLPEVFGALEAYFSLQQRLWRQFISQSMLPMLQLFGAIFVIAGLIFILGIIGDMNNTKPMDPLGIGLVGTSGAITFLILAFGSIGSVLGLYLLSTRFLQQKAIIDGLLLRLPAVGPCFYALAMSRFCLALRFTMETALPVDQAIDLGLKATGNAAFAVRSEQVQSQLRGGDDLTVALSQTGLFSHEFETIIATAEESGRLPEVMKQQAKYYEEEAELKMALLTRMAGFGVWLIVAILIIIAIFRIAMLYLGAIDAAMPT